MKIPADDESIGNIYCLGMLEHVRNVPFFLGECERVLPAPRGVLAILGCSLSADMWHTTKTPDHKTKFAETSWKILLSNGYWDYNGKSKKLEVLKIWTQTF